MGFIARDESGRYYSLLDTPSAPAEPSEENFRETYSNMYDLFQSFGWFSGAPDPEEIPTVETRAATEGETVPDSPEPTQSPMGGRRVEKKATKVGPKKPGKGSGLQLKTNYGQQRPV